MQERYANVNPRDTKAGSVDKALVKMLEKDADPVKRLRALWTLHNIGGLSEKLARDLAKWFLELINRRLRTGRIQPEVVLLATQVAETFGATVEGASMRAALPTLSHSTSRPKQSTANLAGRLSSTWRTPSEGWLW